MKKSLSIILSLIMVLTMLPAFAITASAATETANVTISEDGILTWDPFGDTGVYTIYANKYADGTGLITKIENVMATSYNFQDRLDDLQFDNCFCNIVILSTKSDRPVNTESVSYSYVSSLRKLSEPQNLRVIDSTVHWDEVENATSYRVRMYDSTGRQYYAFTTPLMYKGLDSGVVDKMCWYEVTALADNYRDSNPATSEFYKPFVHDETLIDGGVSPWNVKISNDGILSWDSFGTTGIYNIEVTDFQDGTGTISRILNVKSTSYDLKGRFEELKIETGTYFIFITTEQGVLPASSKKCRYDYISSMPKLSAPNNLNWEYTSRGWVVSWDAVKNATGYNVRTYSEDGYMQNDNNITETSYTLGSNAMSIAWFEVSATADGYRNSNYSESPHRTDVARRIITFNNNDGTNTSQTAETTRNQTVFRFPKIYREGYILEGWYNAPSGGLKVDRNTVFEEDENLYAHWIYDGEISIISNVALDGTINAGDTLNDNGPLTVSIDGVDTAYFSYSKNGKTLASNTKATYGNYDCTVNLFAVDGYIFTNSTVLNFNGKSYEPVNIIDGEIAIFEIPNIYVECNHTSSVWLNDPDNHWKMCSVCKGKFAESTHDFVEQISGSTITFTCRVCGFEKEGKVAETRTAIYRPYIDFGTAMVGDAIPTTVKLDYANTRSGSEKYYNYATVQSVKYSTTGTFKNAKTTVTVVLKANKDYYFESIALPTPVSSCYLQYLRESVNVSEDGTTLTAVFSFTPYTSSDVTLTLPEFVSGKTYAEIAKEVQFKVNGVVAKDYSFSIRKAGESSWIISNISDGVVSGQYMYEMVIEPNTEYEFGVNSNVNRTYAKSLTITNPNVAVITDSYYGEAEARVNANYTSTDGHNYDAGTITKQATCTEDGTITFKCTDTGCESTKTMVIPKKGHQEISVLEIPATCIEEGKTAGTVCSRCDAVLSGRTPIAPTGVHNYSVQLSPEVTPTCNEDGRTAIMKCDNCDARAGGEKIPATGNHDFSKYVSNGNGTHQVVCTDCGTIQEGHDKDACSGGTATCTAKAKCSKCKVEYGSLKAHTNTTTTTKATLTANGKKVTKCSVCGKSSTTTIYYPKTFTLSKTSSEYTGSQIKPTITIKDSNGATVAATNYTVTYGTNKAVGKGTVKVTFKGNYSGTKTVEFKIIPKKTTIGTPVIASDGITVKWTKNTSCAGYYIYRSVNGASYTKVKTITSNATVSWKDTTAKTNGNKYQYKIVAYKTVSGTTYTSAASAIKTIYFLTRPTVTLVNQASAIKVSWGKNAKATGYYVYKSTDGGKTYKKIKTVTSNATVSYTDTAAKTNGTKYMYKVEAYKTVSGTTYKSAVSAAKTMYFVSKPSLSSANNSAAGKMTVKWGKNSKATGYQIQYSTKSDFSSGNKSVTVTSASTVSKTITGLTKGKTYYVRIRTYKTVGSTKYYSAWSAKKTVKITK